MSQGLDQSALICLPVAWAKHVTLGSVAHPCKLCGQKCFVAPSGQRLICAQGAWVCCLECAGKEPTRPAEYLCDFVLSTRPFTTCDRPLCEEHRVNRGHQHFCGRGHGMIVTIDFCPGHAATGLDHKPRPIRV